MNIYSYVSLLQVIACFSTVYNYIKMIISYVCENILNNKKA